MQGEFIHEHLISYTPPQASRFLLVRLLALVSAMLTSQIVAHAQSGYYQVAYTQGSITLSYGAFPSPQINQIDLVSPNLKRYNGSGVSYLIPTYPAFVQAKATLTGPIHVKLTWVPKYPGQPRP